MPSSALQATLRPLTSSTQMNTEGIARVRFIGIRAGFQRAKVIHRVDHPFCAQKPGDQFFVGAGRSVVTSMTAAGADTGADTIAAAAGCCCIFCLTRTPHSTLSMWLLMNEKGTFLPHMGHVT